MTELALTWTDHHHSLVEVFEKLLEENVLVDCTLAAEGKYLRAHKIILSAVSPYFEMLFKQENEKDPIVILTDIKFKLLKAMIDFIYCGKVKVPEEYLEDFVHVAESLQIKGLVGVCLKKPRLFETEKADVPVREYHMSSHLNKCCKIMCVVGNENCDGASSSATESVLENTQSAGFSSAWMQSDSLCPNQIKRCTTSVGGGGKSIPDKLSPVRSQQIPQANILHSTTTSTFPSMKNVVSLESDKNCKGESFTEELVPKMEFVECQEERSIEESDTRYSSTTEAVDENKNCSELHPWAQSDPCSSSEMNQCSTTSHATVPVSVVPSCEMIRDKKELVTVNSSLKFPFTNNFVAMETDERCKPSTGELVTKVEYVERQKDCVTGDDSLDFEPVEPDSTRVTVIESKKRAVPEDFADSDCQSRYTLEPRASCEQILRGSAEGEESGNELLWEQTALANDAMPHEPTLPPPLDAATATKATSEHIPNPGKHVCQLCNKKFMDSHGLLTHSCTTGERPYCCMFCGKMFQQSSNLRTHLRIHTGERPYVCNVCGKTFQHSGNLTTHLRIHTGERPYKCNICSKTFQHSGHLRTHLHIHTGERPYDCKICGKTFQRPWILKTHVRIHTGERPYDCKNCGKTFTNSSGLTSHLRIHSGERPYECKVCSKTFQQPATLKTHLRIHTGERPYDCNFCGKKFPQLSGLTIHLRTHTGERPYICKICGKTFQQPTTLKTHQRIHTGERPYSCRICSKSFQQSSILKRHLSTHEGEPSQQYMPLNISTNVSSERPSLEPE